MDDDLVAMPVVDQDGEVFVGPGAKKEAQLLGLGLRKLKSREKDDVSQAKRYAMELSTKKVMEEQHEAHLKNQQRQSMYCQALALMGRVYIGSISMEVREHDLRKAFENFGPVKNINMSYDGSTGNHKGFAFLEYEVPEAAVIGVDAMNGLYMGGRNLKVGRPANMPQAQPIIDMIMTDATRYNRVYVASVHPDLSETDLKSVFEAFGTVTKCQLARNSATGKGAHRGFGYLEFSTREASKEAITGMNMFDLGGQFLRVGKCITPPEALNYLMPQTSASLPSAAAMAAASITAKIQASEVVQKKKLAIEGTKSSPTQAAKHAAPLHTAIGMDSVNGLYVTANLPIGFPPCPLHSMRGPSGPSPCMELTSSTVLPPHLQAVAAPPPAQLMLGYTPANEEAVPSPPQQGGGFGQPPPPPPYPGMPPPPPAFMPPPPPGFAGPVPPPPPQWGAVPPPPPPSQSRRTGFGGFADSPAGTDTPPGAPPTQGSSSIGLFDPMKGAIYATCMEEDEPAKKKKKKEKGRSNLSVMERIQVPDLNHSTVASFGELEEHLRYKDPSLETEEEPLAILGAKEGDVQAMALALLDGNKALVTAHNRREEKRKQDEKALMANQPGKAKIKKPKKQKKGPKLNTAKELDAAVRAGNITTTIVNTEASSEEASIASQERGQTIRGNDARYSLMTKLMKTTRSNVIMLKNMVTPDDIDEFLEDEIKEECGKYGNVEEVVIVSDPDAGTAKVFVQFRDHGEADEAKKGLHDRFFAGRNIAATSYDQIMFEHGDFTG